MPSCSGLRKFYGSIWAYCYDKYSQTVERFDTQSVKEKCCGCADFDAQLYDGAFSGITRTTTNTRMRDFYDIVILQQVYGSTLDSKTLHAAILATASKRGTERHLAEAAEVFDEVENSMVMQNLWEAYQKKFSYALDFEWHEVLFVIRKLYAFIFKCNC